MYMPFWKSLSDLFDEKIKKKDFTIPRTEKDVWGSEVVIVDGENIKKYKLETWAISVPFKQNRFCKRYCLSCIKTINSS